MIVNPIINKSGAVRRQGVAMGKFLSSLLIAIAIARPASAEVIVRTELFRYNLNTTTETFFVLGGSPGTAGTALIQATASTTVTAVSGSPFTSVSVGDMLIISNSDGVEYEKSVIAKASGASITVSLPAVTLTSASFRWRKLASGTADTNGGFPVGTFSGYTVQVSVDQLSLASGGIDIRLQCRTSPKASWAPAYPATTPPTAQVPFNVTAVGSYTMPTVAIYDSCRVGLKLSGADDATDTGTLAEYVSIYTIGKR